MVTEDQLQGRGAERIQQGREQSMHLAGISFSSIARGGELPQFLAHVGMQAIFDDANLASEAGRGDGR